MLRAKTSSRSSPGSLTSRRKSCSYKVCRATIRPRWRLALMLLIFLCQALFLVYASVFASLRSQALGSVLAVLASALTGLLALTRRASLPTKWLRREPVRRELVRFLGLPNFKTLLFGP